MPPEIDMSAIREALQRRAQGQGGTPQLSQVTPQNPGASPSPVIPTSSPQQNVTPTLSGTPAMPQTAQPAGFDDETRKIGKALIQKLLSVV